jgi:probable selenium-dependent hydroxylase accessory protein YqeC
VSFGFLDPWHVFLPRDGGHVLSFMGSGGKTTLMQEVAGVYATQGIGTVLTTTTRSEVLADLEALTWEQLRAATPDTVPAPVFIHAGQGADGKWRGLTAAQVDALGGLLPERVVLAEVDGAAKHPLKLHRQDEPVWPERTSLAFVVMGVGAVGGRPDAAVHRWGRLSSPVLGELADHGPLEWRHLTRLLEHDGGYLDRVPPRVPAVLALAGLSEQDDSIGLFEFVGRAMEHPELPLVLFCSLGPAGLAVRTACAEPEAGTS